VPAVGGASSSAFRSRSERLMGAVLTARRLDDPRCDGGWRVLRAILVHTRVCVTIICMTQVDRLSVTMRPEIGAAVRDAAARQGTSVSNWLVAAAAQRLRNELLGEALDRWETEDGPFGDQELDAAATALGTVRKRGAA
jgi:hypothetical protein